MRTNRQQDTCYLLNQSSTSSIRPRRTSARHARASILRSRSFSALFISVERIVLFIVLHAYIQAGARGAVALSPAGMNNPLVGPRVAARGGGAAGVHEAQLPRGAMCSLSLSLSLSLFEMYDHSRLARARSVAISLSVLCARARPSRLTLSLRFCTWVEKIYVYSASYIVRAV